MSRSIVAAWLAAVGTCCCRVRRRTTPKDGRPWPCRSTISPSCPAQLTVKVGTDRHLDQSTTTFRTPCRRAPAFRSKAMDTDDNLLVHVHGSWRLQVFLFACIRI